MTTKNQLYSELSTELVGSDETEIDLNWLTIRLSRLSVDHATIVQGLIIHHRHLEGGSEALPYDGNLLSRDRGAKYDLNRMPSKLQEILMAYMMRITDNKNRRRK
uniref:BET bromodomain protein n=1 Tax=Pithovirus LCPAC201 TaxID=2506591 RepID=A0A481Z7S0_9VIRU|nr:MAG: BET bromodomain protein [Pithovirus LCPAC201]